MPRRNGSQTLAKTEAKRASAPQRRSSKRPQRDVRVQPERWLTSRGGILFGAAVGVVLGMLAVRRLLARD